ncbi:MAG: AroM family protein [Bacillota bacterium]
MKGTIGVVTIGQSPRPDVVSPMRKIWGEDVPVREAGALDSLSRGEIDALRPASDEEALVTRLRDGTEVIISHRETEKLVAKEVSALISDGCDPILVLCTGSFAIASSGARVIFPRRILGGLVRALHCAGPLGVMLPHPSQEETIGELWKKEGLEVITAAVSPYSLERDRASLSRAAGLFRRAGTDLIVMDCMGYSISMREALRQATGVPVLQASSATAHAVASAFC